MVYYKTNSVKIRLQFDSACSSCVKAVRKKKLKKNSDLDLYNCKPSLAIALNKILKIKLLL